MLEGNKCWKEKLEQENGIWRVHSLVEGQLQF